MTKRPVGRPALDPRHRRSERISLHFTPREMREVEAMANALDIPVVFTLRRIVLLALKRHKEDVAKKENGHAS